LGDRAVENRTYSLKRILFQGAIMPSKSTPIGRFAGLDLFITPQFWYGCALLTVLIGLGLMLFAAMPPLTALLAGLWGTVLYWLSELLHHLGHATAARRTGHPMRGVRLGVFLILATSLYPKDEGELPAAVHIRRALGGPLASALIGLILISIGLMLSGTLANWIVGAGLLNLFWFSLGALTPMMGMTDGSTLLFYWRK